MIITWMGDHYSVNVDTVVINTIKILVVQKWCIKKTPGAPQTINNNNFTISLEFFEVMQSFRESIPVIICVCYSFEHLDSY